MWRPLAVAFLATIALSACNRGQESAPIAPIGDADVLRAPTQKGDSPTLKQVLSRRRLNCGISDNLPGFSARDRNDDWQGFDVDFCRAVAAAVLGDARAVNFTVLDDKTRFAALQSGVVDLLSRDTVWTFARDAGLGVDFPGVSFYDTLAFLGPAKGAPAKVDDLDGMKVCVTAGATQQIVADYFKAADVSYVPAPADTDAAALKAFQSRDCNLLAGGAAFLAVARQRMARPEQYAVLPLTIAKAPRGPAVREGDDGWQDVIRWTLNGLILAEELGVNSKNVSDLRRSARDPQVRRLLGAEGGYGRMLGLRDDWAFHMIRQVGSYGEIFDRNLGEGSPLKLARGENAQWDANRPGLLYAPPMR